MKAKELTRIVEELAHYAQDVDGQDLDALADACLKANRIFVAGAGRSGFAARGFANRLLHLNRCVWFVGETTTPPVGQGDLLVICSGSGETESLKSNAARAKKAGAAIATLTMSPHSSIASLSDVIVRIPGSSPKSAETSAVSIQPMGSLFEQLSGLAMDAVILDLMEKLGETEDTMFPRHANLE